MRENEKSLTQQVKQNMEAWTKKQDEVSIYEKQMAEKLKGAGW
jgi:hypothetical protein